MYREEAEEDEESLPPTPRFKDLLFMLEFLADTLKTRQTGRVRQGDESHETCLTVRFLHFPAMTVRGSHRQCESDTVAFQAGKSITFGLTEDTFETPPALKLLVSAQKEFTQGCVLRYADIGSTEVNINGLFQELFRRFDEHPDKLPLSKSMKQEYQLFNSGTTTAELNLYVRVTCLGQNVVTEFKEGQPFIFKNNISMETYSCKKWDPSLRRKQGTESVGENSFKDRQRKTIVPNPADDQFEDITVEINGNALSMKVLKSSRGAANTRRQNPVSRCCESQDMTSTSLRKSRASEDMSTGVPDGGVGLDNNRIVFQVPESSQLARQGQVPVTYKVNSCDQGLIHGHGDNTFKILQHAKRDMPRAAGADAFIFNIVKRGKSLYGKADLNLELRTKKDQIEAPSQRPYLLDRETETEKQRKKFKKKRKTSTKSSV